ncbi:hypothetical protein BJ322DRAFT_1086105 [Thelephora terrestris]|uniref:Uncharacterized protein n=1 Tax=Thelephora terrestris TaxID=56493 RepID=A0A9P6H5L4_9AGAM|nr:hypothetical protein BJ322DRAFT_1086105 [Thelephora terrestris]
MAFYHHEADFNHYPTTTPAAARLDAFSNQSLPAAYRFSGLAHDIPADRWGMAAQQGPAFGSQPGLPGGAGFGEHRSKVSFKSCLTRGCLESVDEATSYNRWSDGPSQPSYANHCWPAQSQQPYLGQAGSSDWGTFPARSTMAPGPSSVIPTPSNVPLHHWEANQSGLSASTFDWNVHPTNQSMSCPSRTGQSSTRRFQPYGTSRAREPEQWNAEAGPSTVTLPQTPYVGSPTPEPTGGFIPETTADAENDQHITEEEEAPVSDFYRSHIPHVTD